MAILKDFLLQTTFPEVWALLGKNREDMHAYEEAYRSMFEELQAVTPQENHQHMTIRFVMEEAPAWSFYFDGGETEAAGEPEGATLQVYGFVPDDEEGYAIGVRPADALAGLDVDEETARNYTPAEIVAHCLAEMTYTATMASSAYGTERDMAGGGLLASQSCMDEDIQNIDLQKLREELGALPRPEEDHKAKYGFLF